MREAASALNVTTPDGALKKLRRLGCRIIADGRSYLVPRSEIERALAERVVPISRGSSIDLRSPRRKGQAS
jgi:hypothetical protein